LKTKSIAELAKRLSIDAQTLENTIARYNDFCKDGKDLDFSRPKELLKAVEGPPYYAIQICRGMVIFLVASSVFQDTFALVWFFLGAGFGCASTNEMGALE